MRTKFQNSTHNVVGPVHVLCALMFTDQDELIHDFINWIMLRHDAVQFYTIVVSDCFESDGWPCESGGHNVANVANPKDEL